MKLFDLSGKTAVITGSTKGIGKAIAEQMAEHGANVVISSRKADACEEVAKAINEKGAGKAIAIAANIGDKAALQNLIDETKKQFGQVDIMVCNAAINPYFGPSIDCPDEIFDKTMASNIKSNQWLANMVAPDMMKRKDGVIIVVSSIGGLRGSEILGPYAITKAADMQLVRNLASEYGKHNIRVNAIAPGLIKTYFAEALWNNPEILKSHEERTPLRRIGVPDEIAGAAVFLSGAAGAFMTGQTIVIDGGQTSA